MTTPAVRAERPHVTDRGRRRLVVTLLVVVGLGGAAVGAATLTGFLPKPVVAGDPKASGHETSAAAAGPRPVKVVRPKRDPSFRVSTRQFATVEPYYLAGVRARVPGEVRAVTRNIGAPVRAGELLVEIDAPDLRQAVEQKTAVIAQREREVAAGEAELKVARSTVEAAKVAVRQKQVEVTRARDVRAARKTDLDQLTALFNSKSVVQARVDSAALDFHAAERAVEAVEAEVERAKVDVAGKGASVEKAEADVALKRSLVEVARADRAAAAIQLGYTRLLAPFDGVVVARTADPGKFVAAAGGDPLVTVARTDLVTVAVKVPDNSAPFVSPETLATVEFSQLPGVTAAGPVTRYSPYIDPADQTMRVEVDVYNGSLAEYRAAQARSAAPPGLAPLVPLDRLAGFAAARSRLALREGWREGDALVPDWGPEGGSKQLVPGMTATVRLDLKNFADAFLLPSGAVYGRAGQSYLLVVENGVTRAVPVAVQVNDGTLVKVAAVTPSGGRQVTRELTGAEVVVAARQLEVGEGTRVTPVPESW